MESFSSVSQGHWYDISIGDISSSISNGCATVGSKIQNGFSWTVQHLQGIWSNYLSPGLERIWTAVSSFFSASKDFVQANPITTVVVAGAFALGSLVTYLFQSRKAAAPNI